MLPLQQDRDATKRGCDLGLETQPMCSFVRPWRSDGGLDGIYAMFWGPAEQNPQTLLAKHRYSQGGMDREQCPVSGLGIFVGDVIRIWVCNWSSDWGVILTWVTEQRSAIKGKEADIWWQDVYIHREASEGMVWAGRGKLGAGHAKARGRGVQKRQCSGRLMPHRGQHAPHPQICQLTGWVELSRTVDE